MKTGLQQHNTSVKEIADLLKLVGRDLADADIKEISADRRFARACNAALQLATIVLQASATFILPRNLCYYAIVERSWLRNGTHRRFPSKPIGPRNHFSTAVAKAAT